MNKAKNQFKTVTSNKNDQSSKIDKHNLTIKQESYTTPVANDLPNQKMQADFQQTDPFTKISNYQAQSVATNPQSFYANQPHLSINSNSIPSKPPSLTTVQNSLPNKPNVSTLQNPISQQQNPLMAKTGSANNPINVDGLTTTNPLQTKPQQASQTVNSGNIFSQNKGNLQSNISVPLQQNQPIPTSNNSIPANNIKLNTFSSPQPSFTAVVNHF